MFNHCLNFPESNTFYAPPLAGRHVETRRLQVQGTEANPFCDSHFEKKENRMRHASPTRWFFQ